MTLATTIGTDRSRFTVKARVDNNKCGGRGNRAKSLAEQLLARSEGAAMVSVLAIAPCLPLALFTSLLFVSGESDSSKSWGGIYDAKVACSRSDLARVTENGKEGAVVQQRLR